jgi:hypothetical protein
MPSPKHTFKGFSTGERMAADSLPRTQLGTITGGVTTFGRRPMGTRLKNRSLTVTARLGQDSVTAVFSLPSVGRSRRVAALWSRAARKNFKLVSIEFET